MTEKTSRQRKKSKARKKSNARRKSAAVIMTLEEQLEAEEAQRPTTRIAGVLISYKREELPGPFSINHPETRDKYVWQIHLENTPYIRDQFKLLDLHRRVLYSRIINIKETIQTLKEKLKTRKTELETIPERCIEVVERDRQKEVESTILHSRYTPIYNPPHPARPDLEENKYSQLVDVEIVEDLLSKRIFSIEEEIRRAQDELSTLEANVLYPTAAVHIQRLYRGNRDRKKVFEIRIRKQNRLEKRSATKIQSVYRGHYERHWQCTLQWLRFELETKCAIVMQRIARGHRARNIAKYLAEKRQRALELHSCIRIQCFWRYIIAINRVRMIKEAKALAEERERRLQAAIFIQRVFRGWWCRKYAREKKIELKLNERVQQLCDSYITKGDFWEFLAAVNEDYVKHAEARKREEEDAVTFIREVLQKRDVEMQSAWNNWNAAKESITTDLADRLKKRDEGLLNKDVGVGGRRKKRKKKKNTLMSPVKFSSWSRSFVSNSKKDLSWSLMRKKRENDWWEPGKSGAKVRSRQEDRIRNRRHLAPLHSVPISIRSPLTSKHSRGGLHTTSLSSILNKPKSSRKKKKKKNRKQPLRSGSPYSRAPSSPGFAPSSPGFPPSREETREIISMKSPDVATQIWRPDSGTFRSRYVDPRTSEEFALGEIQAREYARMHIPTTPIMPKVNIEKNLQPIHKLIAPTDQDGNLIKPSTPYQYPSEIIIKDIVSLEDGIDLFMLHAALRSIVPGGSNATSGSEAYKEYLSLQPGLQKTKHEQDAKRFVKPYIDLLKASGHDTIKKLQDAPFSDIGIPLKLAQVIQALLQSIVSSKYNLQRDTISREYALGSRGSRRRSRSRNSRSRSRSRGYLQSGDNGTSNMHEFANLFASDRPNSSSSSAQFFNTQEHIVNTQERPVSRALSSAGTIAYGGLRPGTTESQTTVLYEGMFPPSSRGSRRGDLQSQSSSKGTYLEDSRLSRGEVRTSSQGQILTSRGELRTSSQGDTRFNLGIRTASREQMFSRESKSRDSKRNQDSRSNMITPFSREHPTISEFVENDETIIAENEAKHDTISEMVQNAKAIAKEKRPRSVSFQKQNLDGADQEGLTVKMIDGRPSTVEGRPRNDGNNRPKTVDFLEKRKPVNNEEPSRLKMYDQEEKRRPRSRQSRSAGGNRLNFTRPSSRPSTRGTVDYNFDEELMQENKKKEIEDHTSFPTIQRPTTAIRLREKLQRPLQFPSLDESIHRLLIHAAIGVFSFHLAMEGGDSEDKQMDVPSYMRPAYLLPINEFFNALCAVEKGDEFSRREMVRARVNVSKEWVQPYIEV